MKPEPWALLAAGRMELLHEEGRRWIDHPFDRVEPHRPPTNLVDGINALKAIARLQRGPTPRMAHLSGSEGSNPLP